MSGIWWKLPGPSEFVEELAANICNGRNMLVCLPMHSPRGLGTALRDHVGNEFAWSKEEISSDESLNPEEYLYKIYVGDITYGNTPNLVSLLESERFCGRVIWIEGINSLNWPSWKSFMEGYSHACRSQSLLHRTVICLCATGFPADLPFIDDVCLSKHNFCNYVSSLDMFLYVSGQLKRKCMKDLQRKLIASIVTNIAFWDPVVSDRLLDEGFDTILQPDSILRSIANERGWDCREVGPSWENGMKNIFDGAERMHSSALMLFGAEREIRRRIWSAQIGVLLPFIEEKRAEIIENIGQKIKPPFRIRTCETVQDINDVEIGQLPILLINHGIRVEQKAWRVINLLKFIRNSLAHLETLAPDTIHELLID